MSQKDWCRFCRIEWGSEECAPVVIANAEEPPDCIRWGKIPAEDVATVRHCSSGGARMDGEP